MVKSVEAFSFAKTPEILFGEGSISSLGKLISIYGSNIGLITGGASYENSTFKIKIENSLKESGLTYRRYSVTTEPSPGIIDSVVSELRVGKVKSVVAVGGGSVMDAGKAISVMLKEEGSVKDFLEGVGTKSPSGHKLPFLAIPTTSGTGSETTKNAVISELGPNGFKRSLRHNNFVPDIAIVDPELTLNCPPDITAASGMDAFTQLLESYLSTQANAMSDALALSGLTRISNSLMKAFKDGNNIEARTDMAYAAMLSGITLSNAGLGVIHGFAQPLGSLFPIPHGIVCGGLMGVVNRITVEKLRKSGSGKSYLDKYARIGNIFYNSDKNNQNYYIDAFLDIMDKYVEEMNIPRLNQFGVKKDDLDAIVQQTGLKNHPVTLSKEELLEILWKRL